MFTTSLRYESVSCTETNLQLPYECRVRHEECRGLLKHVLKPYDIRSDRQFYIVEIVYDFSMTRAARAIKIAWDNRKKNSYRVNRPLRRFNSKFLTSIPVTFTMESPGDNAPTLFSKLRTSVLVAHFR